MAFESLLLPYMIQRIVRVKCRFCCFHLASSCVRHVCVNEFRKLKITVSGALWWHNGHTKVR
jgi:hypothetical protein